MQRYLAQDHPKNALMTFHQIIPSYSIIPYSFSAVWY